MALLYAFAASPSVHAEDGGCPDAIVETFGSRSGKACAVAWCESTGWDNSAIGAAGEVSYFQIHPIHFSRYSRWRLIEDEWYAAEVAYEMSSGGRDWSAWSCS